MKRKTVCNLKKVTPSGAEDASYRLMRSLLNQPSDYPSGEVFEYVIESARGMYLKDSKGITLYVTRGECRCFEDIE